MPIQPCFTTVGGTIPPPALSGVEPIMSTCMPAQHALYVIPQTCAQSNTYLEAGYSLTLLRNRGSLLHT
jgi:hypothetical protein